MPDTSNHTALMATRDTGSTQAFAIQVPGSTQYVQNPAIRLAPGNTYNFVMDNVNPAHFFYLSTSPVGLGEGRFTAGVTNDMVTVCLRFSRS